MIESSNSNIWTKWRDGYFIVIPTNNTIKINGETVMGAGLAKVVSMMFPDFPNLLGTRLRTIGKSIHTFPKHRLITFPVKHNWWEKADLDLIRTSAKELVKLQEEHLTNHLIYLPRVGCGNGKRDWEKEVKPILEEELESSCFIITSLEG